MKLMESAWSTVVQGLRACSLRFEDPREEAAFRKSLEPELLRWSLFGMLTATLYGIFHEAFVTGPSALAGGQHEHFRDMRYRVFLAQLVMWALIPALLCSLVAVRVVLGVLARWNWEAIIACAMIYGGAALVVGQTAFMTRLAGEDPDAAWQGTSSCSAEAWVLVFLCIFINLSASIIPIRTVLSWTVLCACVLMYTIAGAIAQERDKSMLPLKIVAIFVHSVLVWSAALRNERHLRREWGALQQVSEAEDHIELQQSCISAKGQDILDKDAKIEMKDADMEEVALLVQGLQIVMSAVCETMVLLSPELKICNTTASHDLFFERPVEGEVFTDLLLESDAARLAEALSQVSERHVPACLPVTLHKQCSICEVTLLIADRGPQSERLRYLVGVRVDKETQVEKKIARCSGGGDDSGQGYAGHQATTASLPNHVPSDEDADDEADGSSESCEEVEESYSRPPPALPQQEPEGDGANQDAHHAGGFQSVVPDPDRIPSGFLPSIGEDSASDFEGMDHTPAHVRATYPPSRKHQRRQKTRTNRNGAMAITHVRSRARTIRMMMKRWCLQRSATSCCHFHTVVRSLGETLEYMLSQPCDLEWEALKVQCPRCLCLNTEARCLVCGLGAK